MTRFRHEPVKRFGKEININSKIKDFYNYYHSYCIQNNLRYVVKILKKFMVNIQNGIFKKMLKNGPYTLK